MTIQTVSHKATFPAYLPPQPVSFLREPVRVGRASYDGERMGAFGIVPCVARDPRGRQLGVYAARQAQLTTDEPVNGFVIVHDARGGSLVLPQDWFFADMASARNTVYAFCMFVAQGALQMSAGKPTDDERMALAVQLAAGNMGAHRVVQHKTKLMRIAARYGAFMGETHDLKRLWQALDKPEMTARLAALKATPGPDGALAHAGLKGGA